MASLLSARRTSPDVSLHATQAERPPTVPAEPTSSGPTSSGPPVGWPVIAVAGGLTTAAASWILVAGLSVLGWLAADPGTLSDALGVGTHLWLLTNGVSARIGTIPVTLVPWAATALIAFMLHRFALVTARLVRPERPTGPAVVAATLTAAYLVPVLLVGVWLGEPWQAPLRWAVVIAVLAGSAFWGSARILGSGLPDSVPRWVRSLPRAALAAQLTMLAAGAAVLATAVVVHLDRVSSLYESLQPGIAGSIALLVGQLAVAPNALIWAASYALGAGFSLGNGSVVAPAATELGIVPAIPLLGALPSAGPGSIAELWWLGAGALAGAAAAWVAIRAAGRLRADLSSLLGGVAGVVGAVFFAGAAWAASGDLGTLRLAGLGPRLLPVLVMAGTTMGLAGMITGLALALAGRTVRDGR